MMIKPQQSVRITNMSDEEYRKKVKKKLAFWRQNPHKFVEFYFDIRLAKFQQVILCGMFRFNTISFLAARGAGKTFLLAVFSAAYSILYPGTIIRVASKTRRQAAEVIEKITLILMGRPKSFLKFDVNKPIQTAEKCCLSFKNGSLIDIVTAAPTGRSKRAHILILDEGRMLSKNIIDAVLEEFLKDQRKPPFMDKPEYTNYPKEATKIIYASSAWYKNHWYYDRCLSIAKKMSPTGTNFCVAVPYQALIQNQMIDKERMRSKIEAEDFDAISFMIENECIFWGDSENGLFPFNDIDKNRKIKYPFYPDRPEFKISDERCKIPIKKPDEIRILSADIALMASTKHRNDASSLFLNCMTKQKSGKYLKEITYTENLEGLRTDAQALIIRKLISEFDCDYIAIDCKGAGLSIADLLMSDLTDPVTGEVYEAISCCNNKDIADRCLVKNAPKKLWAIQGSSEFNSQCVIKLKEALRQGEVRLLISDFDAEEVLESLKGYDRLSMSDRVGLKLPYVHTSLLVNELVNLEYEVRGNAIKVKEKAGMRKDRFSSLSYNVFISKEIEREQLAKRNTQTSGLAQMFKFRAPKIQ